MSAWWQLAQDFGKAMVECSYSLGLFARELPCILVQKVALVHYSNTISMSDERAVFSQLIGRLFFLLV